MARSEYVHRRAGTKNLHYERPVPPDLKNHPDSRWHGKQWATRQSLRTSDSRSANEAARRLSVHWDELFQAERDRLHPQTIELLTPEMTTTLVQGIRARLLSADDELRTDPGKLHDLLAAFELIAPRPYFHFLSDPGTPRPIPNYLRPDPSWPDRRGIRPDQLERLREIHELWADFMRRGAASGNLGVGRSYADRETRERGFRINWDRPENRPGLLAILRGAVSAWIDRARRDAGDIIDTPTAPEMSAVSIPKSTKPAGTHTIADALDLWKKERERSAKTLGVFTRHAAMFSEFMGDPPLESLTLPIGLEFKDKVQAWAIREGKTVETANNVLSSVRAMLRLSQQRGWNQVDPLVRVSVKQGGNEGTGRLPWSVEDLGRLFASPLFTAYQLPETRAACDDAAYWVPLILAYTGARPGEVAQLWTDDVFLTASGGLAIEFRENTQRGQKLKKKSGAKTSPSWRVTPVHDRLIELGFADYWKAIAARGVGQLFPSVTRGGQNGYGAQVGKWFGVYKRDQGFKDERKDLHSFRHTVRTELGLLGVSSDLTKAITGHASGDVHDSTYGATMRRRADELRPAVNILQYPGLHLQRVFRDPRG